MSGSSRRCSVSRCSRMDAIGVFSSWVTALMKLSCCSFLRISRTRKLVLRIKPATMAPKKRMPRRTLTPSCQLTMIQPKPTATEAAARRTPSVRKKTTLPRLETRMDDFSARSEGALEAKNGTAEVGERFRNSAVKVLRLDGGEFWACARQFLALLLAEFR